MVSSHPITYIKDSQPSKPLLPHRPFLAYHQRNIHQNSITAIDTYQSKMSGLDSDLKKIRERAKRPPPPTPQVPYPWRTHWDNLQYLYVFENVETWEREWEIEKVLNGDHGDGQAKADVSESGEQGEGGGR
ncbi:hypothetical protein LTR37_010002 [Vermiconidia calcicola]|uniref:Uncharacterized protein n=1 Tax=Vermiconidia calcicola TaxID=1690605 RepID=A0ACC3N6B7_9PEZI|nr:hypothetical protein LTR37_010002 [Vermiconidia calcicola]